MPSIAQQDYIRVDALFRDGLQYPITNAAAYAALQRLADRPESLLSVLIAARVYDSITEKYSDKPQHFTPILGVTSGAVLLGGSLLSGFVTRMPLTHMGSIDNCETLAILEEKTDTHPVKLRRAGDTGYLRFVNNINEQTYVAVGGKYVAVTLNEDTDAIETLEVTDVDIPDGTNYADITEEELMKLIGAPRIP